MDNGLLLYFMNLVLAQTGTSTAAKSATHLLTTATFIAITERSTSLRTSESTSLTSETQQRSKSSKEYETSTQISRIDVGSSTEPNLKTSRNEDSLPITETTRSTKETSKSSASAETGTFADEQMGSTMSLFEVLLASPTEKQYSTELIALSELTSRPTVGPSYPSPGSSSLFSDVMESSLPVPSTSPGITCT